jgi:hypothetical protein
MKQAIIAIEDRRFYTNAGIDIRGIGRALWQDVRAQQAVQGGSTITMQFVKNALAAQDERTLFNKLREAALAYQSRASGPRSGSSATTSTRSTSATAPTASSPPPAPTSASTIPAAAPRTRRSARSCSSPVRRR